MSEATPGDEPTTEDIVAFLFRAAMSGDEAAFAAGNGVDVKLITFWKFAHAQEYITYLESILRAMRSRTKTGT